MPPISELAPILFLFITFVLSGKVFLGRAEESKENAPSRFMELDGLRAILAFGVMMHHFFMLRYLVDYRLLLSGKNTEIVNAFGTWTVQIFFAITAFLFTTQIVDNRDSDGYFLRFFIKRILRLGPLNLAVGLILAGLVVSFGGEDAHWYLVTFYKTLTFSSPQAVLGNVHALKWMGQIAAGPLWSIHAEWLFYLCAPFIGLVKLKRDRIVWAAACGVILFLWTDFRDFIVNWHAGHPYMTWAFLPGIALGLTRSLWIDSTFLKGRLAIVIAVLLMLLGAFIGQLKVYIPANIFVLAVVLSSNKHLSFLNLPWLRSLGETTYSIYLLHGIIQFVVVNWIVTMPIARSIPEWEWWLFCGLQVVVIVALARLSYQYIEKPGIVLGSHLSRNVLPFLERRARWITKWI